MKATIDREGRIALAKELQAQLGLQPGDEVVLECHDGEWVIKAAGAEAGLCREGNVLVHRGAAPRRVLNCAVRDERMEQLSRGTSAMKVLLDSSTLITAMLTDHVHPQRCSTPANRIE